MWGNNYIICKRLLVALARESDGRFVPKAMQLHTAFLYRQDDELATVAGLYKVGSFVLANETKRLMWPVS